MAERGAHHVIFPLPEMERGDSIERFGRDVIRQLPQAVRAR